MILPPVADSAGRPHRLAAQIVRIVNAEGDDNSKHQFSIADCGLSRGEWATVVWALRAQPGCPTDPKEE